MKYNSKYRNSIYLKILKLQRNQNLLKSLFQSNDKYHCFSVGCNALISFPTKIIYFGALDIIIINNNTELAIVFVSWIKCLYILLYVYKFHALFNHLYNQ